ncbi:type II secretion system F family protein [Photobacterium sp. WH77]|uniref:type II secretion system F family protein n=1 Tax=unclassified Photobacterium TaxID=2628852 RepID=UPI001EDAB609|nr:MULTISPECIES: type II secretion system F family protein [unclassified Photobacterium]MCG2836613.1 type II secretion system F family protein [Photobacterium sp. WH77]MCG2844260.1 type II secretion system F family protein [Photobacterium sp. WH80]
MVPAERLGYFRWRGRQSNGRSVSGVRVAFQPGEIEDSLRIQSITPQSIRRIRPGWLIYRRHRFRQQDLTNMFRQLASLLSASLPLSAALAILTKEQSRMEAAAILNRIQQQVTSGTPLSEAVARHTPCCDAIVTSLLKAGEFAGQLPQILEQIASYREQYHQLQRTLFHTLLYPAAVCVVAMAVTALMLVWIIPQFAGLFATMGHQLPWLTRAVLTLSDYAGRYSLQLMASVALITGLCRWQYRRSLRWQYRFHHVALLLPLAGTCLHLAAQARFTRTLGTTFQAGVPLLDGLNLAASTCGNRVLEHTYRQAARLVAGGQPLHSAIRQGMGKQRALVPERLIQLIMVGEETGKIDTLLFELAAYYDNALSQQLKTLTTLLEPVLILVIGIIIGTLLLAMYLPVFDLMKAVG